MCLTSALIVWEGWKESFQNEGFGQTKIPFILPFISDELTVAINKYPKRTDLQESLTIIEISAHSLSPASS